MGIRIERHTVDHAAAVRAFNARLTAHDAVPGFLYDELPPAGPRNGAPIVKDSFLAVEDSEVRGGFALYGQAFWIEGRRQRASNYRAPISEGIFDRRYAYLGMLMVKAALREDPLLFCVGMGGLAQPLPRLLAALDFKLHSVPFLFRIHRPARVLRELPILRATRRRALIADLLARTGAAWLGVRLHARATALRALRWPAVTATSVTSWGPWADELWESARETCSLAAVRDAAALAVMYPLADRRNVCLRLAHGGRDVGWTVLYDRAMRQSAHFGNLRVGTVLDCWARPGFAEPVARAATRALEARGVDLMIVNHAHTAWVSAFRRVGYLVGPSNYGLALSPALAAAVRAAPDGEARMHVTRGDADGRVHL